MAANKEAKVWFSGVPTDIDVQSLRDRFGVPAIGMEITHGKIEAAIDPCKRDSLRYRTVIGAWRKRLMRDHNILLMPMPTIGFKVADNKARVNHCSRKSQSGLRSICRASQIAESTDEKGLDQKEIGLRRHLALRGATVRLAIATSAQAMK